MLRVMESQAVVWGYNKTDAYPLPLLGRHTVVQDRKTTQNI